MTLQDIRVKLVELSGRHDLLEGKGDFFIRSGQRFLDGLTEFPGSRSIVTRDLEKGSRKVNIGNCKVVDEVRLTVGDKDLLMKRLPYTGFVNKYTGKENGKPAEYTVEGVDSGESYTLTLLTGPTPDSDYQIKVKGKFPSAVLVNKDDKSFWSVNHPDILVQSALYQLEKYYRNTQGAQDHLNAILQDVQGIQHDIAEDESKMRDQMDNSW